MDVELAERSEKRFVRDFPPGFQRTCSICDGISEEAT